MREGVLKGFSVGGRGASSLEGAWSGAVLSKGFKTPGAIFLGRMCGTEYKQDQEAVHGGGPVS